MITMFTQERPEALFIKRLRSSIRTGYSEQLNAQLQSIWLNNPDARDQIIEKLEELKSDRNYALMIDLLNNSGMPFFPEIDQYLFEVKDALSEFSRAIYECVCAVKNGREDHYVPAILNSMELANTLNLQWLAMADGFHSLNKLGQHQRAQCCSLIAYHIAQQLEDEALRQRSEFAILHSTRMVGNADVSSEYLKAYNHVTTGELLYSEMNQCLVPIYAAMHLLDLRQDNKMVATLLGASNEYLLYDFAKINNKTAWARYHHISGRSHQAMSQMHELIEEFTLSTIDASVMSPLRVLAHELNMDISGFERPDITTASRKQWNQFDVMLDRFWQSISMEKDSHAANGNLV